MGYPQVGHLTQLVRLFSSSPTISVIWEDLLNLAIKIINVFDFLKFVPVEVCMLKYFLLVAVKEFEHVVYNKDEPLELDNLRKT